MQLVVVELACLGPCRLYSVAFFPPSRKFSERQVLVIAATMVKD